ncbi:MAG: Minf_1886 family protein [Verrucomicrobiota bacterium]|jgi:uncharacterized repeat protein (TIGR04138 family)
MKPIDLDEGIRRIVAQDPRYPSDAYLFVQEAIQYTQRTLGRHKSEQKHVAAKELLEGIRECALRMFGPMAPTVFDEWGIHTCEDFGEIVFNMIDNNLATKTQSDSRDDFKGGYSFEEVFRKPYLPSNSPASNPRPNPHPAQTGA